MANRHQMRQCWEYTSDDVLCIEPFSLSGTRAMQVSNLPSDLRLTIAYRLHAEINMTDMITTTNQLRFDHIAYVVNQCIILQIVEEEDIPLYFKIKYILMFRDTWILCGRLCFCQRFNRHLHAYSVNVADDWAVVYPGEEADSNSHVSFVIDGCNFVTSKYTVPRI